MDEAEFIAGLELINSLHSFLLSTASPVPGHRRMQWWFPDRRCRSDRCCRTSRVKTFFQEDMCQNRPSRTLWSFILGMDLHGSKSSWCVWKAKYNVSGFHLDIIAQGYNKGFQALEAVVIPGWPWREIYPRKCLHVFGFSPPLFSASPLEALPAPGEAIHAIAPVANQFDVRLICLTACIIEPWWTHRPMHSRRRPWPSTCSAVCDRISFAPAGWIGLVVEHPVQIIQPWLMTFSFNARLIRWWPGSCFSSIPRWSIRPHASFPVAYFGFEKRTPRNYFHVLFRSAPAGIFSDCHRWPFDGSNAIAVDFG